MDEDNGLQRRAKYMGYNLLNIFYESIQVGIKTK